MARSLITAISSDLVEDSGAVLFSIVQGEQLEFPIVLNFIAIATTAYTYEAVVIEANNITDVATVPTVVRPGGIASTLNVRVPSFVGTWVSGNPYNYENVVLYAGNYYRLTTGIAYSSAVNPATDTAWVLYDQRTVYVQFPEALTTLPAWAVQPSVVAPVHGFFELRVTEPAGGIFRRTWKPVRGLISIMYSPTALV
jgi:hypothetical protein